MGDEKDAAPRKRGKNWTDGDSLKLTDAYQEVQFNKLSTPLRSESLMPLESDTAGIIDDKVAATFNANSPEVEGRSSIAIKERWKKMVEAYRSLFKSCVLTSRYIQDFSAGRAVGSTGQPPWFDILLSEQKKFLNGKVSETS
jgi:hypothetical protein